MSCVQLIYFALPLRQSNFTSNRKAKNVQALKVSSSDVLKHYTVLIRSRRNFVTATWKAILPVVSISFYPVKAESIPQRGRDDLSAASHSDNSSDLWRTSVRVCRCVSEQHLQFEASSLSPGFGHHRDGLPWQKMSDVVSVDPVVRPSGATVPSLLTPNTLLPSLLFCLPWS